MEKTPRYAVIGAGAVGLSTALSIQNSFPSAKICIYADKFGNDTLSSGAGGIFRPEINVSPDSERVKKWCRDSFSYFSEILKSVDASKAGVQLMSGYQLSKSDLKTLSNPLLKEFLPEYRPLTEKEISIFPSQYKSGYFFSTIVIDCRFYLKWMQSKFEQQGGEIITQHINDLSEIPEDFDIIINCAGLGAKQLMNDSMMMPIRGQTIKIKAPWIKQFYYGDEVYIIPGLEFVTLGGIKDYGSWNMNVNPYQKNWVWDKCTELIPSLKNAEILWDWVGLRPFRPEIRVEASLMLIEGKHRKVVNNYGHGGHGIALSWGTAVEATGLVQKILTQKEFFCKL